MASRQLQDRIQALEDILTDAENAMNGAVPQLEQIPDIYEVLQSTQVALSRITPNTDEDNMTVAERAKNRMRNNNISPAMVASKNLRDVVARIQAAR